MRAKKVTITLFCLFLIVLMIATMTGCRRNRGADTLEPPRLEPPQIGGEAKPPETPRIEQGPTYPVTLYFASQNKLSTEVREIPKVVGIARAAIQELIKGPGPGSELARIIPHGTELLDINIKQDGTAIVNFSEEIVKNLNTGSEGEALLVYSIVNTLTEFPTVSQVQIWVDGKVVESLAGHVNTSRPLTRNERYNK